MTSPIASDHGIRPEIIGRAVPIDSVTRHPRNYRRGNIPLITDSLRINGQYRPIIVQASTGHICAGNHTWQAAQELGWHLIAADLLDLDDEAALRILAVDNRANDQAENDDQALAAVLRELDASSAGLAGTGWNDDVLAELLSGLPSLAQQPAALGDTGTDLDEIDEIPEPPADPVTAPGDLWLLGPHRILCGDCRNPEHLARLLDGATINVAFTSPPYASQRTYDETSGFKPIPPAEYSDWFEQVQEGVQAHLAADGSWFVNIKEHCDNGQRNLYVKDLTIAHVRRWGWRFVDELCWVDTSNGFPGAFPNRFKDAWEPVFHFSTAKVIKFDALVNGHESDGVRLYDPDKNMVLRPHGYSKQQGDKSVGIARPSNVLRIAAGGDGTHPAEFPVALPSWFIRAYSDEGDNVFDPFMGSGTTLVAAHNEQRIAYGTEISPAYVDVICRRWQIAAGVLPVLAETGEQHDFLSAQAP
ncbi:DNA modification methylase [Nonomuraea sp. NPDC026600]|uniref:DNA modification methylase n=1 Tax=Nonomuraea sp. NPDC026600 TaxID=3155363 RepID=UPI0033D55F3E